MLQFGETVGSVLSRAYQRVVDRLNTPSARVPTESVQIQNVPQMVTMGTQSEHGGLNVFQQTAGGKTLLLNINQKFMDQAKIQRNLN